MKVVIIVKAVDNFGYKTMQRLSRNLVGLLGLACVCACQTTEFEVSKSDGQALKNVQTNPALERREDAHVNYQNTVDKTAFYDLPKVTNWTILSLADFSNTLSGGRHSNKLTNHSVEATKSSNSAILALSDIPSCEGAGGRIVRAGGQKWVTLGDFRERLID